MIDVSGILSIVPVFYLTVSSKFADYTSCLLIMTLLTCSKMLKYRATHAEFVIPCQKYLKSIANPVAIGTRFKVRFEMDDSPERRYFKFGSI